jgi:hypothetical protein
VTRRDTVPPAPTTYGSDSIKSSVALVCGFGLSICYQYRVCVCVCVCVCLHVLRRHIASEAIAVVSELCIIAVAALGESYRVAMTGVSCTFEK